MAGVPQSRRTDKHPVTLLCIDDQAVYLPARKAFLEAQGYEVFTAASGPEGLAILKQRRVDCAIIDYRMPVMDGAEVARKIRRIRPDVPIIMFTGYSQEIPAPVRALVDALVFKGRDLTSLLKALDTLLPKLALRPRPSANISIKDRSSRRGTSAG